jgi:high-affinity Fe2+/Pb2+ permease
MTVGLTILCIVAGLWVAFGVPTAFACLFYKLGWNEEFGVITGLTVIAALLGLLTLGVPL